ncbi:hypothetical protein WMY93_020116 [Mugilogobius chulae]|uniref:Uncharacterized protein n=1 Tax=Mugilogobius chulae TaxID=88201 RepID=A0AAW0NH98_9GOBI
MERLVTIVALAFVASLLVVDLEAQSSTVAPTTTTMAPTTTKSTATTKSPPYPVPLPPPPPRPPPPPLTPQRPPPPPLTPPAEGIHLWSTPGIHTEGIHIMNDQEGSDELASQSPDLNPSRWFGDPAPAVTSSYDKWSSTVNPGDLIKVFSTTTAESSAETTSDWKSKEITTKINPNLTKYRAPPTQRVLQTEAPANAAPQKQRLQMLISDGGSTTGHSTSKRSTTDTQSQSDGGSTLSRSTRDDSTAVREAKQSTTEATTMSGGGGGTTTKAGNGGGSSGGGGGGSSGSTTTKATTTTVEVEAAGAPRLKP